MCPFTFIPCSEYHNFVDFRPECLHLSAGDRVHKCVPHYIWLNLVISRAALVVLRWSRLKSIIGDLLVWKSSSPVSARPPVVSASHRCVRARVYRGTVTASAFAQRFVPRSLALALRISLVFCRLKWLRTPRDNYDEPRMSVCNVKTLR